MSKEYDKYAWLAKEGTLPADFNQWGLVDEYSGLGHRATRQQSGAIFLLTLLNEGRTVAHEAAKHGRLPKNFNQWGLASKGGWTVAHEAAYRGFLPADFSQWGLTDKDGLTVLHQLLSSIAKSDKYMTGWEEAKPLCKTEADWDTFKTELPDVYQKYSISEYMLDIDNDQRALQGASQRASQRALL